MDITDRTVLIVGGTLGIGLGLAHRFAAAGSTVIVGGRNTAHIGDLPPVKIDVTDPHSVRRARDSVLASHRNLDVIVTMSGVMLTEDLREPSQISAAEQTIATNLLGTIRVIHAFTPHLIAGGAGTFVTVSSGIGFLPFPLMPTYGASKAGVHAYSESPRAQLDGTGVEVVPPAVATTPEQKQMNPNALDLDAFLDEVITLLAENPTLNEILVQGVLPTSVGRTRRHLRRPRRASLPSTRQLASPLTTRPPAATTFSNAL